MSRNLHKTNKAHIYNLFLPTKNSLVNVYEINSYMKKIDSNHTHDNFFVTISQCGSVCLGRSKLNDLAHFLYIFSFRRKVIG